MPQDTPLSRDERFFLLSSRRRRFVLRYLRRTGGPVDRSTLVDALAAWENDVDAEELSEAQRRTVDVSLYQTHLEELADAGVVTYDADAGRVAPTDRIEEFAVYLDRWQEVGTDALADLDAWDAAHRTGEGAAPGEEGPAADEGTREAVATRELGRRHYVGLALASLGLYAAVVVDSGVLWRVPLVVAAVVVIGLVAVHVYPLYSLRGRGPFRTK